MVDPEPSFDDTEDPTACPYTDYSSGPTAEDLPATGTDATGIERAIWDAIYEVDDPEMPVSIVDLGLIYGIDVDGDRARIDMTLTYTGCPARNLLTEAVRAAVTDVAGIEAVDVRLVWSPPWSVEMVTDRGKKELREFGLSI